MLYTLHLLRYTQSSDCYYYRYTIPRQSGLHWFFSAAFTSGRVTKAELKFGLASHAFMIFLWEGLYFNVVGTIPLTLVQFIIFWADLPGFSSFQAIFQDSTEM